MSLDISISLRSSIGAKIRIIFGLSAHSELKITFRGIIFEPILGFWRFHVVPFCRLVMGVVN